MFLSLDHLLILTLWKDVLSNGKDQAMRLWDLRKMRTSAEFDSFSDRSYGVPNFDYR